MTIQLKNEQINIIEVSENLFSDEPVSFSEEHGCAYLGGYVAKVCGQEELFKTKNDDSKDSSLFMMSDWMQDKNVDLGVGGLCYPRKDYHADLLKMEAVFKAFHSSHKHGLSVGCSREPEVVARVVQLLKTDFGQYNDLLLFKLVHLRTMIRVRTLKRILSDSKIESVRSKRKTAELQASR